MDILHKLEALKSGLEELSKSVKSEAEAEGKAEEAKHAERQKAKAEPQDPLKEQETVTPGVSSMGIEVRRGDVRIGGVMAHGYQRVAKDPNQHMAQAKETAKQIIERFKAARAKAKGAKNTPKTPKAE